MLISDKNNLNQLQSLQTRVPVFAVIFAKGARSTTPMELVVVLRKDKVVEQHKDDAKQRQIHALRVRAEEARSVADGMHHASTRATMLRIASTYERTADLLENSPQLPLVDMRRAS